MKIINRSKQRNYASSAGVGVEIKGRTLVNLLGILGRTQTSATITVTSASYYLIVNSLCANVTVNGTSRSAGYKITGVTSLELTWASGYTAVYAITAGEYSGSLVGAYLYVDSVQFKANTMLTTKGKNLFDKNSVTVGYGISDTTGLPFSSSGYNASEFIPVKENTQYAITYTEALARWGAIYDKDKVFIARITGVNTFTTPANAVYVRLTMTHANLVLGQLELGSVVTTFEPFVSSTAHSPLPLDTSESVYVMPGGQSVFVEKWKKGVQLTGDLAWGIAGSVGTTKRVWVPNSIFNNILTGLPSNNVIVKYNGSIIPTADTASYLADIFMAHNNGFLYLNIADADSGFANGVNPTSAEIKAYFYGWRMTNPTGTSAWDGTSAKNWIRITTLDNRTTTCPTATYAGFTPYTLAYKMANAVTHINYVDNDLSKPILSPGSALSLPVGIAQIEQKIPGFEVQGNEAHGLGPGGLGQGAVITDVEDFPHIGLSAGEGKPDFSAFQFATDRGCAHGVGIVAGSVGVLAGNDTSGK